MTEESEFELHEVSERIDTRLRAIVHEEIASVDWPPVIDDMRADPVLLALPNT